VEGLWIWLVCGGVPLLFGLWAHPIAGHLTDHYDPRSRTLNLSQDVGQAATVTALTYVAGFVASLGQLIYFFLISRR
jgi:Zn-dependent membrane protease YugP